MRVRFFIPGEIKAWARAGKHGKIQFTPAPQRNFMGLIRDAAMNAMGGHAPMEGPVCMSVIAVYPWGKSVTKKRREAVDGAWKDTKPDADNVLKIIKDSLNKIVYADDAQCCDVHVRKVFGVHAGLHVEVVPLAGVAAPAF